MKDKLHITIMMWLICSTSNYGMQKIPVQDFLYDKDSIEVLKDVAKTRQDLFYEVNGIKVKKTKDPREGLYTLIYIGAVYTPSLDTSNMMGIEVGYDFIFNKTHSLRVFGFFDRTNYAAFADLAFDVNKPNRMQIYRARFSAEYRAYANAYVGFRVRPASLGLYSLSRTSNDMSPTLTQENTKWLYPSVAFGSIFTYGKHRELFLGYDLVDYKKQKGMSINYLKYSLRF